jgi:hypothetical protein
LKERYVDFFCSHHGPLCWTIFGVVSVALFMSSLDGTIVATAAERVVLATAVA